MLTLQPLPGGEYAAWREGLIARRAASPRSRGIPEALAVERAREVIDRQLPPPGTLAGTEVLAVQADGRRAGTFFVMPVGDSVHLGDLLLSDPTHAPTVRELLVDRLHDRAVVTLGIEVTTGDPAGAAFVEGEAFDLVATQMQLDLATAPAPRDPGRVTLRPMGADDIAAYFSDAVETFADETMSADPSLTREAALANSREVHDRILPQGVSTPGHEFLVALDAATGRHVGITWLFHEERAGFVYDVEVDEAERGRGYGRALMDVAAEHMRELGMEILGLNVFGHNHAAYALYDALGCGVIDRSFNLALSPR
ncbi:GNAT family N-acetyltransferase [Nocardioides dilutus]